MVGTPYTTVFRSTGDVTLDSAGTVTQTQAISAAGLELIGGGDFQLASVDNEVATLAANVATLQFKDNSVFEVVTVSTAGITLFPTRRSSDLGTVTQTQAISAAGLELIGGGDFQLASVDNEVATLAANVATQQLKDNTGFEVGKVNTAGITATGDVTLDSAGTVTQTQAISAAG